MHQPFPHLHPGQRVRLSSGGPSLTLTAHTGTVVRPDDTAGHYVIRLDAPATYHQPDGRSRLLDEIVEASDNVELIAPYV